MARKKADPLLSFDLRLTRLEKRVLAMEGIIVEAADSAMLDSIANAILDVLGD